jgi:hypothetical protein
VIRLERTRGFVGFAGVVVAVGVMSGCGADSPPNKVVIMTNDTASTVTIAVCQQRPPGIGLHCAAGSRRVLAPGKSAEFARPFERSGSVAPLLRAADHGELARCSLLPPNVGPDRLLESVSQMAVAQCR